MITVLLVDDNDLVRKSLRSLLELTEDIQIVATAANGVEAVDKACSYCPDVAVLDISMPLMNGIEATEHIRECCRLTRVILVTGYDKAVRLLEETLNEESAANEKLTKVAESHVNVEAR